MSDRESRMEDAKRERWEEQHWDDECPSCDQFMRLHSSWWGGECPLVCVGCKEVIDDSEEPFVQPGSEDVFHNQREYDCYPDHIAGNEAGLR